MQFLGYLVKYQEIIEQLKSSAADIERKGVTVVPLHDAIGTLEQHADDISALEENIEAVRSEITKPILQELGMGQSLSKSSYRIGIFGAILGAVSIVFSIYTNFKTSKDIAYFSGNVGLSEDAGAGSMSGLALISARLERIESEIIPIDLYDLGEFEIRISDNAINQFNGLEDRNIGISFSRVYTSRKNGIMGSRFELRLDGIEIGDTGLAGPYVFFERELGSSADLFPRFRERIEDDSIYLFEGEIISVYGNTIAIVDIDATEPLGRALGDQSDTVVLSINPIE
jgi:Fe-S-cluster formation regulator IscX/YfhJ